MRTRCLEKAATECSRIAFRLYHFLADEQVRERLRTWREEDSAGINDDNIETIKIEANRLIVRKIMTEIKTSEKQNGL